MSAEFAGERGLGEANIFIEARRRSITLLFVILHKVVDLLLYQTLMPGVVLKCLDRRCLCILHQLCGTLIGHLPSDSRYGTFTPICLAKLLPQLLIFIHALLRILTLVWYIFSIILLRVNPQRRTLLKCFIVNNGKRQSMRIPCYEVLPTLLWW